MAGFQLASPGCSARTRASPVFVNARFVPARSANSGARLTKPTASPLDACALTPVTAPSIKCAPSGGRKFVMAWSPLTMVSTVVFVASQFAVSTMPVTA